PALEAMAKRLVPATPEIIEAIKSIPGLLEKLNEQLPAAPDKKPELVCSNGRIDLSDTVQVLVGGRKVVVCK
ncbi:mammalian cell entry protein, partial [Mycobacterium kansasii]